MKPTTFNQSVNQIVAPNSLSFCFCLRLSNVTNYKSAALEVRQFLIHQHFRVR